jgi:hypothetical protein
LAVGLEVLVHGTGFDIKDVDEDFGVGEDVLSLNVEVGVHVGVLTTQ